LLRINPGPMLRILNPTRLNILLP